VKALITLISLTTALLAQTPAPPTFEVASVKLNKSGSRATRTKFRPGAHFTATNITLHHLILMAYEIRDFQLSGGPSWIDSDRYDIDPKAADDPPKPSDIRPITEEQRNANSNRIRLMIQSLLAERFKLAVHKESKEGTVYWLVVAKNGLKIKELPPSSNPNPPQTLQGGGNGVLHAEGIKLADLVDSLVEEVGHPVIDKTNLTGNYNLDLKWTPDHSPADASNETNGPSIFTALQEQAGLKLEPHKAPVDVLVIDQVEKPTEN
jgi:uncharacterized protein (TIGR03435 family)